MVKIIVRSFWLMFISIDLLAMHSIHISYGESELEEKEFRGKITFYYDDFMLALKNWNKGDLKNFSAKQFTELKNSYLKNHLNAIVNGKIIMEPVITGNNGNDKSIWFEFKFTSDEKINSIKLKFNVLLDEFSDQLNLLNVSSQSGDRSFIFSGSKNELNILD